jgi:hypothetical protein
MFDRGVVHVVVDGYIVDHYCFLLDRRVVHVVVVGYRTTPLSNIKQYWSTIYLATII